MGTTKKKKSLGELTMLDRFLFAEAMENPENMKILLDIILGEDVVLKYLPQTEKEIRKSLLDRMAKIDVWAMDTNDVVYDTEVQQKDTSNLPKRSRYYQGMIDSKLLAPGQMDFNDLNKVFIIMIMPFDLFGKGLYMYTFRNTCDEVPGLELGDDAIRIFLNTRGTNEHEVNKNLVQLLHFLEYTNDSEITISDEKVRRLQKNVKTIQQSAEIGVKYMQLWEEMELDRLEVRAEARAEGLAEGRAEMLVEFLESLGELAPEVRQQILEQKDLRVLKDWFKKAMNVSSLDEFLKIIK